MLKQSIILSILGFVPGTVISWLIYRYTAANTGYTMDLSFERASIALLLTVFMCTAAGLLAIRRLSRADPAELFR